MILTPTKRLYQSIETRRSIQMQWLKRIGIAAAATFAFWLIAIYSVPAHAAGACDGFQRCRCGTTAARYHGLPYSYNGLNLKKASEWYAFPRTSFGIGAVGVAPHHVLTVTAGSSCSSATVHDDAGTYQRNVCGMTFVSVSVGGNIIASAKTHHKRGNHSRYAERVGPSDYMSRAGAGV